MAKKSRLSELTLVAAAEIILSAGCNFTLGAYKSTLYFFQIICGRNLKNTLKVPGSYGTSFGPLSIASKGHKRMQTKFRLCKPCSTAVYLCIFFPCFNLQLLSASTVIADKIMKIIATGGKMRQGMGGGGGRRSCSERIKPLCGFKYETNSMKASFWALRTRLSVSQM